MGTYEIKLEHIEYKSWILTGGLLILSLPFRSLTVSAGVALGALLAILNFKWLRDFARTILSGPRPRVSKILVFLYTLKYVFTGLVVFLSIKYDLANPLAILGGVSVIFLAICWEGILSTRKVGEGANHAA